MSCITLTCFAIYFMTTHPCLQGTIPNNYKSINLATTPPGVSSKRPQWKKTAVEKVYGDKDYSI